MGRAFALWLLLAAGCYQPSPVAGAPCAANAVCPAPLVCTPAGTCERTTFDAEIARDAPNPIDAAVDARPADARPTDARPTDARMLDSAAAAIAWRATSTQVVLTSQNATSVTITTPPHVAGDVLIAVIAMGRSANMTAPVFTPPTGWTPIRQINHTTVSALAVYWHVAGASEPTTYTFGFDQLLEGLAWISSYSGVSTTNPVDTDMAIDNTASSTMYSAPTLTTTTANTMLVVSYAGHDSGTAVTWAAPTGANVRANLYDGTTRSALGIDEPFGGPGATPALIATASTAQEYALVHAMALRSP